MNKILIIDDDHDAIKNLTEILKLANYSVFTAEDGISGIEVAKKVLPELILCDVMMPGLDGYGVLEVLNRDSRTSKIPLVLIGEENNEIRKGMNLGADDFLIKPLADSELLKVIETRLNRHVILMDNSFGEINGKPIEYVNDSYYFYLSEKSVSNYKKRTYKKKETIYYEGDEPSSVYYIISGKVKTQKTGPEDKEFVMEIFGKNEFLGYPSLLDGGSYPDSAIAMNEVSLAIIPKEEFLTLVYNDLNVSRQFIKILASDIRDKEERLTTLAFNSVRARVAGVLLHLQKKNRKSNKPDSIIHISRDDLAGLIGTTTESLIRTLTDFKQEGLIKTKIGEVKIVNQEALEKARRFS